MPPFKSNIELAERITKLETIIDENRDEFARMQEHVAALDAAAEQYRGGAMMRMSIGGLIGFLLSALTAFFTLWSGTPSP